MDVLHVLPAREVSVFPSYRNIEVVGKAVVEYFFCYCLSLDYLLPIIKKCISSNATAHVFSQTAIWCTHGG